MPRLRADRKFLSTQHQLGSAWGTDHKQTLAKDFTFWSKCENRWGQGPGYRLAIRDMTDDEFEMNCEDAHKFVNNLLLSEWEKLIVQLEGMLQDQASLPVAA